jgi:hypothetical protein
MEGAMARELQRCRNQIEYLQMREDQLMEYVCQLEV